MKTLKLLAALFFFSALLISCNDDDDDLPPVNEEELITTMTVTLIPEGGGTNVVLKTVDLDGDGPNPPVITVSGPFSTGTTYQGSIELLNESVNPAEDITEEVEEEAEEHQFFHTVGGALDATTFATNFDGNGHPLGTEFTLNAANASTGTLTFTLRHEPKKPNSGLADAGGETDITATFNVAIE
ncbi:type 1 periplasmic binding fold superfamily protein [Lutimonas saemankumensis]|uniref:type 1 periplasmic binding fold superfamily protein n=1 Tax=Lutimonas saemankumensis TaxID=483016 RepID=UPI001CD1FF00|nr:type 1 periplasmic binding fold superfamily protein [Lutimonas saemankumensis]MCA0933086.1 type 1 periplasmic binding fold superfamily protein [Lutimonas saemankumensis]